MVRIQGPSDYDRLDTRVHELVEKHGFDVDVTGWTRKTYDIFRRENRHAAREPMARVESFATTSGEITVFDESAFPFAKELGTSLEADFGVTEAVIVEQRP